MKELAVLTSHPIQYQAPLFRKLAERSELNVTVYFCWNFGVKKPDLDREFGVTVKWDTPVLEGYKYKFLKNLSLRPSTGFWGQINFGIIPALLWKKYDAVLIFGWNSLTNWLAFGVAVLSGSKVLMRGESPLNQESSRPYWKLAIKRMVLKRLFKRISAFLCIGEENRKFYEHYGAAKEKLFFAPYAVDNNFFMSEAARLFPKKSELRKLLGLKGNKFIFLFVGKFIDKKRPMDLIRAYELVKDPKKALVMVGDGILKEEAAKYVREQGIENVIFAGFKNQTELPEYYALADALVLPSGSGETWGLVVNEAMCFGLSVIVSDVVGCGPDLVKQDENGFVFHLGNIKELSHCLEELAADPEKKERFGKRSIEIIRDFSFDKDADAIASSLGPIK